MNYLDVFVFFFAVLTTVYCDFLKLQVIHNTKDLDESAVNCSGNVSAIVEYSRNVLRCARKCLNNVSCKGIVYNKQQLLCEVVMNGNLSDCSPSLSGTIFGVTSRVVKQSVDKSKSRLVQQSDGWIRIASINANGTVTFGDISSLKRALLSGKWLQITFGLINNVIHSATVNTVTVTGDNLCAQSNDFIHPNNYPNIGSFIICTNGKVQSISRSIGAIEVQSFQYLTDSTWFVRELDNMQVVNDSDSKSFSEIYNQLDATQAFILTIVQQNNAFTKIHYKTYTNLLDSSQDVMITSSGEISMTVNGSSVIYADDTAWVTTTFNFTSTIYEERCSMGGNMPCETQVYTAIQKAAIDLNWEKVFHHTAAGNAAFGSISSIRISIMKSQRLLIHCEGNIREPDLVIDGQTDIAAFFTSYPSKRNYSDNSEIVWEMLTASGRYERLVFDASSGDILTETSGTRECIWFVDKVAWTKVYDLKYNTSDELRAAVESGSRIRIKVNCLADNNNSSSTAYTCLFGSSFIQVYTKTKKITARSNLYPSITNDNFGMHLSKQSAPTWMNFNLVAYGNTSRLRRNVLINENPTFDSISYIFRDTVMINDEWYAN